MTKEQQESYTIAKMGILKRLSEMRKSIDMIESWMFYGEMEKSGKGKCAIVTEESVYLSHDEIWSKHNSGDMVTRHPITGEKL